jgi:SPOR domain
MIRRIAAVLLAANLAFWGWAHWLREERAPLPETSSTTGATPAREIPSLPAVQPDSSRRPAADDELLQDCIRLTGFASQSMLDAAAGRLAAGNMTVTTGTNGEGTAEDAGQAEGHWVHVAGLRDSNAQRELIDRLRSAGLADAYAMPNDAEHRVSVGLFSDATRARQRVEQLRTLGIESSVLTRTRGNPTGRWLELRGALPADITAQVIQGWGLDPALVSLSPCQQ